MMVDPLLVKSLDRDKALAPRPLGHPQKTTLGETKTLWVSEGPLK